MELELDSYNRLIWRVSSGRGKHVICDACDKPISKDSGYLDLSGMHFMTLRVCEKCYLSFLFKTRPKWFTKQCKLDLAADQF